MVSQHYYKIDYEWAKIFWILGIFFIGSITIVYMHLLVFPYMFSIAIKVAIMILYINIGIRYDIISKENFKELKYAISSN